MTTRNRAQADAAEEAQPFGDPETTQEVTALVRKLAEAMDDQAAVRVYDPAHDATQAIQIDQDNLIGQAFAVTGCRVFPVIGNYDTGEVAYHLLSFSGQAVKLDSSNNITRRGRIFACTAGQVSPDDLDSSSVLGREMWEVMLADPSPAHPILFPLGIRKVATAAGGHYYTTRPDAARQTIDLFPG